MIFKNILALSEKHGFLRRILPKLAAPVENNLDEFAVGPTGTLLLESLKTEWLNSMVNNKEFAIFYSLGDFVDHYLFIKNMCSEKLPFGLADIVQVPKPIKIPQTQETEKFAEIKICDEEIVENTSDPVKRGRKKLIPEDVADYANYFNDLTHLRCTMFIPPSESLQIFHQWQRQRRVWWRKFSPNPGRYFTTEAQNDSNGSQTVEIRAKYPWGNQLIETLILSSENHLELSSKDLQNKFGAKKVQSQFLTSQINVSTMYLNTICDAFEELKFQDSSRILLKFHRKLAPYKIGFSLSNKADKVKMMELRDLSTYLCKKLRTNNITSLLLPSSSKLSMEQQFIQCDQLGIPYIIVLNENTLKNGILQLRSRDTSLKEQVHVSELSNYIEMLFKNY